MNVVAEKAALRKQITNAMKAIAPNERARQSAAVCERIEQLLVDLVDQRSSRSGAAAAAAVAANPRARRELLVTGYLPMAHELDLLPLFRRLWSGAVPFSSATQAELPLSVRTFVPKMLAAPMKVGAGEAGGRGGEMVFVEVRGDDDIAAAFEPIAVGKSLTILELRDAEWQRALGAAAAASTSPRLAGSGGSLDLTDRGVLGGVAPFSFPSPWSDDVVSRMAVVLAPAACFDRDRRRLGKGGGYYDAFLSQLQLAATPTPSAPWQRSAFVVGVGFDEQLLAPSEVVPQEAHDQLVDLVCVSSTTIP